MAGKEGNYYEPSQWAQEYPHTIYFYYVEPLGSGRFAVRAYMWVNPNDDPIRPGAELEGLIGRLAANARRNGTEPRSIGSGFKVPWWKKSYFVIALEDTNGFEHNQAIEIMHIDGTYSRRNHTFFDGGDGMLPDADGQDIAVAWTVNHMKTRYGEDLGDGEIHRFSLRFTGKGKEITDGPDNGTNMGPPIGPP